MQKSPLFSLAVAKMVLVSPTQEGITRFSWPRWLVKYQDGIPTKRSPCSVLIGLSPCSVLTGLDVEYGPVRDRYQIPVVVDLLSITGLRLVHHDIMQLNVHSVS